MGRILVPEGDFLAEIPRGSGKGVGDRRRHFTSSFAASGAASNTTMVDQGPTIFDLVFPALFCHHFIMNSSIQTGFHGRVPVPQEKRFLIHWLEENRK